MLSRLLPVAAALLLTLGGANAADAYIGPGAGFAFLSSFLVLAVSFSLALLSLLLWPFRLLLNRWRRRTGGTGSVERVVIVGLDGLDPGLAERYMAEGKLPNFSHLKAQGTFAPLATSYPSISPAAWSSFMTGVDCSHHNIFDFLTRDPRNSLLSKLAPIRPVDEAISWVIGRDRDGSAMRFPGSAVPINQAPIPPARPSARSAAPQTAERATPTDPDA